MEVDEMKVSYRTMLILHVFVGIGAMAGGMAAILNPLSPFTMPVETLKNSPFDNFLIPGIILFTIIGLGNIFGGVMLAFKSRFKEYSSGIFGGALVIWIIVQCIMIRAVAFLHVLFFFIGLIQFALAAIIIFNKHMFPSNIILSFYNKMRKEI